MYHGQKNMRPTAATIERMRCSRMEQVYSSRPTLGQLLAIFAGGSLATYVVVKLCMFAMYFFIFGHLPQSWVV